MDDVDDLDLARTLSVSRMVLGAALFFAPRKISRLWTGTTGPDFPTNMVLRGMGARDVALAVGALTAIERGTSVRGWLEAGALVDGADAVGTLAAWRDLPAWRAVGLLSLEVGAAYLGARLAASLD